MHKHKILRAASVPGIFDIAKKDAYPDRPRGDPCVTKVPPCGSRAVRDPQGEGLAYCFSLIFADARLLGCLG